MRVFMLSHRENCYLVLFLAIIIVTFLTNQLHSWINPQPSTLSIEMKAFLLRKKFPLKAVSNNTDVPLQNVVIDNVHVIPNSNVSESAYVLYWQDTEYHN